MFFTEVCCSAPFMGLGGGFWVNRPCPQVISSMFFSIQSHVSCLYSPLRREFHKEEEGDTKERGHRTSRPGARRQTGFEEKVRGPHRPRTDDLWGHRDR